MSHYFEIKGGASLNGEIKVGGAKNAALPLMMASLMTDQPCIFTNVPNLEDIHLAVRLLEHFGASVIRDGDQISITTPQLKTSLASYSLVKALRASFWVLGPVLARNGEAQIALPGGDIIGTRPVDIHMAGLAAMGANIKLEHGLVQASAPYGLRGADIKFPFPSVGATHQIMMAAALTPGTTTITNAACEPEIENLALMLNQMGAEIEGAGTPVIVIKGRKELGGCKLKLIGDRIEAGTYLVAGAIAGGTVKVSGFSPTYLGQFSSILGDMGVNLSFGSDYIEVSSSPSSNRLKGVSVSTAPFPGFATDLQAPLMSLMCTASGVSRIEESVFEGRFTHVSELARMGAIIDVHDRQATISGVDKLSGAPVEGFDIRGAAALLIAGLGADGITNVYEPSHIRRGYENIEKKLSGVGASITYKAVHSEDSIFIGC